MKTIPVIGISGLISCGKGSVADHLIADHGYRKISFADSLKDCVAAVFGWDRAMLEGDTDASRAWRERPDEFWSSRLGMDATPRYMLQYVGTDVFRRGLNERIWVFALQRKIADALALDPDAKFVIPDVRFPDEVDMVRELGGENWMVSRGQQPEWWQTALDGDYDAMQRDWPAVHPSEYMWVASTAGNRFWVFDNNGTLDDLRAAVSRYLNG